MKKYSSKIFFIFCGLLLIGCSASTSVPNIVARSIYQNITFDDLMKKEGCSKSSKNIYVSENWYRWDFGNDKGAMLTARKYCVLHGGKPMNYSFSFNQDTKNDSIPSIVEEYIKSLPKTNIDYSYTPCKKANKTVFAVITEYRENKENETLKRYIFVKSDEIDKSIMSKKKKIEDKQKKLSQLKNRFGNYEDVYFTEYVVGPLNINNHNQVYKLFSNTEKVKNSLLCSFACAQENENRNGYSTLGDALNKGWKIIKRTNKFSAQEIIRDDGIICSCFGYYYKVYR